MPIYLDIYNLVVAKDAITKKYKGGVDQFKIDTSFGKVEMDGEDDELLLFVAMNWQEFGSTVFDNAGLLNDVDYAIISRYSDPKSCPKWLSHNCVFVWHHQCCKEQVDLVQKYCNMTADDFYGKKLFKPIHSKSIKKTANKKRKI